MPADVGMNVVAVDGVIAALFGVDHLAAVDQQWYFEQDRMDYTCPDWCKWAPID